MGKFLDRWFLDQYRHDGIVESYGQARALVYMLIALDFAMLLLIFLIPDVPVRVLLGIVVLSSFFLLFLVARGRYNIAGLISVAFLSLLLTAVILVNQYKYYYEVYLLTTTELFVMVLSLLITTRIFHVLFPMVTGVLGIFYIYFFRAMPAQLNGGNPDLNDYIISFIMLVFSAAIVVVTNLRGTRLLSKVEGELRSNSEKAQEMEKIIEGMEGDFNTGADLIESSSKVSQYVDQIRLSLESVRDEMNSLSISVIRLNEANGLIGNASGEVSRAVENQTSVIEESSSAVTEMAVSIDNISKVANERKSVVEKLSSGSRDAGDAIESALDSMKTLKGLISSMEEINSVINGIAEQTSLLAMNAAIEAAHAGEAGKGFAVVADEVRKLSEGSSENVQIISSQLQELHDSISMADTSNQSAFDAYQAISSKIGQVVSGMDEIIFGVNELSTGTDEIHKGTALSVDSTASVKSGVSLVNEKIGEISQAISGLDKASGTVLGSVEQTIRKLAMVQNEADLMKQMGQKNADNLKKLGNRISSI